MIEKFRKLLLFVFLAICLISCEKDETPPPIALEESKWHIQTSNITNNIKSIFFIV